MHHHTFNSQSFPRQFGDEQLRPAGYAPNGVYGGLSGFARMLRTHAAHARCVDRQRETQLRSERYLSLAMPPARQATRVSHSISYKSRNVRCGDVVSGDLTLRDLSQERDGRGPASRQKPSTCWMVRVGVEVGVRGWG